MMPKRNPTLEPLAHDALIAARANVPLQYGITVVVHGGDGPSDFQLLSTLRNHTELDAWVAALASAAAVDPAGGEIDDTRS